MGKGPFVQGNAHSVSGQGYGTALDVQLISELAAAHQSMVQAQQQAVGVQILEVVAVFNMKMRHFADPWGQMLQQTTSAPKPGKDDYPHSS
ncbi:hypothetical protein D3C84_1017430 [compost metagenome]